MASLSDSIDVTREVPQGDVLSPLLYALYTRDLRDHFMNEGFKGIKIDHDTEIILISFADGTIILANSPVDCQDKLNSLGRYCDTNDLIVNPSKTCILSFFRGRPCERKDIYYEGKLINYVNEPSYLGITFSSSGKFLVHTDNIIK